MAPCHALGQVILECLAENPLLHTLVARHLILGVDAHGHIHKLLVEEGHATLNAPSAERLVGTEAVVQVQFAELTNRFVVQRLSIGCLVEVEVSTE